MDQDFDDSKSGLVTGNATWISHYKLKSKHQLGVALPQFLLCLRKVSKEIYGHHFLRCKGWYPCWLPRSRKLLLMPSPPSNQQIKSFYQRKVLWCVEGWDFDFTLQCFIPHLLIDKVYGTSVSVQRASSSSLLTWLGPKQLKQCPL